MKNPHYRLNSSLWNLRVYTARIQVVSQFVFADLCVLTLLREIGRA